MGQKILIDLEKFRQCNGNSCDQSPAEGLYNPVPNTDGLKSVRELAVFRFTCRKCEDAPCITVCPADAIEREDSGIIHRSTNLCISCKSCVAICPFGTMMTDFFVHIRDKSTYYDLQDPSDLQKFINACPEGSITKVDMEENPEENIYALNDNILVKEFIWETPNK